MRNAIGYKLHVLLFQVYAYVLNVGFFLSDLYPPPFRMLFFRLILGRLGKNCLIDHGVYLRFPSRIFLGNGAVLNRGCEFFATTQNGGAEIRVGDNVTFSPGVKIYAAAHDPKTLELKDIVGNITIGNNAWIGASVIILPGVSIGEGVVVGAGSLVNRDLAAYTICVGSPAREVKKRVLNN